MVNQFVALERGEQGDVELVGEGRFGKGGLQSVDVGTRKVFARQCDPSCTDGADYLLSG